MNAREINEATGLANGFGRAMSRAFEGAIVRGRDFGDVTRGLALRLSSLTVGAAFKPLEQGFGALLQNFAGGLNTGGLAPMVTPFAKGGVIASPAFFPHGPSLGLIGEQGAESILPLARGRDGRLGVRAGGDARPVTVTVNNSSRTPRASAARRHMSPA